MLRILHVEDDPDHSELIELHLKSLSTELQLEKTESAKTALERIRSEKFDCILCDYQMAGMDGLKLLQTLRNEGFSVPFIFLTGQGNEEIAAQALRSGADDYFTKGEGLAHYERLLNSIKRVVDALERKKRHQEAEEALRASEAKYRSLFENSKDVVYFTSRDGRFLDVNPSGAELFGYTREELLNISVEALYEDTADRRKFIDSIESKGYVKDYPLDLKKRDLSVIHAVLTSTLQKDSHGRTKGYQGIIRDVTALRHADEELRKRAHQQVVVAELGQLALESKDTSLLMSDLAAKVVKALGVDFCAVLEVGPDGKTLRMIAGEGWGKGSIDGSIVQTAPDLRTDFKPGPNEPVIITALSKEDRIKLPPLLRDNDIVCGVNVSIRIKERAFGILGAYSNRPQVFTSDDIQFLQSVSSILAAAIERKHAEDALQEGERFLESIFTSIQDGVSILDTGMRIVRVNPTMEKWYSHALPLIGKVCYRAYHGRSKRCRNCPSIRALETGEAAHEVVPKTGPGGKVVGWLDLFSFPLMDLNTGQMKGVIEYVRDITKRKQAEDELFESKKKYQMLVEKMQEGVLLEDENGLISFVNPLTCDMLGYSEQELVGRRWQLIVPPGEIERIKLELKKRQKGLTSTYESSLLANDGRRIPVLIHATPIVGDNGRFQGVLSVFTDITERKKAETALRDSEEMYKILVNTSPDAVTTTDMEGRITFVSQRTLELHGYDKDKELLGKSAFELVAPEEHERARQGLQSTLEEGIIRDVEYTLVRRDVSRFMGELNAALIRDSSGEPKGFVATTKDITERKRAEELAKKTEERFRAFMENSSEGIWCFEFENPIKLSMTEEEQIEYAFKHSYMAECNDVMARMYGYEKADEIIGVRLGELMDPSDPRNVEYLWAIVNSGYRLYNAESHELDKDGNKKIFLNNIVGITEEGRILRIWGTQREITEQKRAEDVRATLYKISEAAATAENLQELFRLIHQIVGELMPAGNFYIALYDPAEKMISFPYYLDAYDEQPEPRKAGKGLTEYVLWTGKTLLASADQFEELEGKGEVELIGSPCIDWLGVPLKTKDRIIGVLTVQSYTEGIRYDQKDAEILEFVSSQVAMAIERKRAEEALRTSEERFRTAFEAAAFGMVLTRLDSGFFKVNPAFCRLLGYSEKEFLAKKVSDITHPDDIEESRRLIESLIAGETDGDSFQMQKRYIHKNGHVIWGRVSGALVRDSQGNPIHMIGEVEDISERRSSEEALKKSHEKLEQRTRELEEVNQELEAFDYSVSHDLQSLIWSLSSYSGMLLERYGDRLDAEGRKYLERLQDSCSRMSRIVTDLLKLSRTSSGELQLEQVNLSAIAEETVDGLRKENPQRKVAFVAQKGLLIEGDKMLLKVALENLLGNAWKFTSRKRSANIEFGGLDDGKGITYYVRDNGVGFSMADEDKLFKPFSRLHDDEDFPGTGIGLATVQRIVRKHGGRIWAKGKKNKGATFYFTLD
jgi:PAS domain S-box-containing protein